MNNLVQFLTSKEIIAVYFISGIACIICMFVYIIEKHNERARRRHNTKELNKLIEKVREKSPVQEESISYDEPILETVELLEDTSQTSNVVEEVVPTPQAEVVEVIDIEQEEKQPVQEELSVSLEEELEYTSMEPDQETARLELERLTRELEEQEKKNSVIELTNYEEEQEASAIISMDELLKRGKELYETNEVKQYDDDGNEPISIQDLERKMKEQTSPVMEVVEPVVQEVVVPKEKVAPIKEEVRKFKSTPFISPIFGIEKSNDLALENTANYEKLDEQIKKSNEFVMSLKEFQKNLD